jgi:subtilisin family serine protease
LNPSRRRHALAAIALAAASIALPLSAQAQGRPDLVSMGLRDASKQYVPDELIVQFRASASEDRQSAALAPVAGRLMQSLRLRSQRSDGRGDMHRVKLPAGVSVAAAIAALQGHADVDFAEPNWVYRRQAVSNDTYFTSGQLWGMYGANTTPANTFGTGAATAWANGKTCSADVFVAVIDEGAMFSHADLNGQFWVNPHDPVDGIDNDGNGYIDDVRGWDFVGDDNTTFDGRGDDHGTHVAGTIGGKGGNGAGVVGMCWSVKLISAKFLGSNGGTTADAVLAVDYVSDLKTLHNLNLVATNNSWGGGGFSQALQDAITRAGAADILFVASAGNSSANSDVSPSYPAAYNNANIISVASIDSNGRLSSFSNYGATTVDLGAPGGNIFSTLPGRAGRSTYGSYSGTSMAAPHVTGAVAMYKSINPGATAAQIKSAILSSATPTPALAGKTVTGGRLNVSGF